MSELPKKTQALKNPSPAKAGAEKPARSRRVSERRGKGRPALGGSVGRTAIIEATIKMLRHTAPGTLTLKEVAKEAGVDAALVRYYFGDKDGLLRDTVAQMLAERQARSQVLLEKDLPPESRLRERITMVLTQQCTDPNFHRLAVEQLFSLKDEQARQLVDSIAARGLSIETSLLQGKHGDLRTVDPRFLNICILGMCDFFSSSQPLVAAMFGKPVDESMTRAYIEFLVDLLLKGLRKDEAPPPRSIKTAGSKSVSGV